MASNIYEEPKWALDVTYRKGVQEDRGEIEERLVDIYERADAFTPRGDNLTHDRGAAVKTNPFKAAALILALLCLLLLVGITVLSRLYISEILKRNVTTLHNAYDDVSNSSGKEKLFRMCQHGKTMQLQDSSTGVFEGWVGIRYRCYYKSTEMKNWTESRRDCQNRGADLVIINSRDEHEFVGSLGKSGASWIGLQAVETKEWSEEWEWKWVDNSDLTYRAWQKGVSINAINGSKVYIDLDGNWNHNNTGSKHWICEKPINTEFTGDHTVLV